MYSTNNAIEKYEAQAQPHTFQLLIILIAIYKGY